MDWTEVPAEVGGKLDVATWHELVEDNRSKIDTNLPDNASEASPPVVVWEEATSPTSPGEVVEYTQAVSPTRAMISVELANCHRIS